MEFRHLDYPPGTPVTELGPAALDALLDRGDLEDWAPLARAIADDPWGATADTVLRLCEAHPMYGTSVLWRTWIERRRGRPDAGGTTLAEARAIGARLHIALEGPDDDRPRPIVLPPARE